MMKRNIGKHTSREEAKLNILRRMSQFPELGFSKSVLGKIAFHGYDFQKPQSAAFAVAKIVRGLEDDGLVRLADDHNRYITRKGLDSLRDLK